MIIDMIIDVMHMSMDVIDMIIDTNIDVMHMSMDVMDDFSCH